MKANHQEYAPKRMSCIIFLLCSVVSFSCSKKKDDPPPAITTEAASITSMDALNGCATATGAGSKFFFVIPYKALPGTVIKKVEFVVSANDGTKKSDQFNTSDGTDGFLNAGTCARFATSPWIDYTFILVSADGMKSTPSKLRITRPSGAL